LCCLLCPSIRSLDNPDWKYDFVPEILDGKNISGQLLFGPFFLFEFASIGQKTFSRVAVCARLPYHARAVLIVFESNPEQAAIRV
jgi:hypothetical protein